jgi:methionyl aminopeptidase
MIAIRRPDEVEKIAASARIVGGALRLTQQLVAEGMTTRELDERIEAFIRSQQATPSFKGYNGFPASTCISINDVVVHGIPSEQRLQRGDIVSVDVGVYKQGYHGDGAWTFAVGEVPPETTRLLTVTREALAGGIRQARPGVRLGVVSHAIQSHVEANGFSVVRVLVGHGIGSKLHEEPQVPNFGHVQEGPTLRAGMVLAIEPMVNQGGHEVFTRKDGWTVVTQDHRLSAHFEHTVAVTENGPRILTTPGPADSEEGSAAVG